MRRLSSVLQRWTGCSRRAPSDGPFGESALWTRRSPLTSPTLGAASLSEPLVLMSAPAPGFKPVPRRTRYTTKLACRPLDCSQNPRESHLERVGLGALSLPPGGAAEPESSAAAGAERAGDEPASGSARALYPASSASRSASARKRSWGGHRGRVLHPVREPPPGRRPGGGERHARQGGGDRRVDHEDPPRLGRPSRDPERRGAQGLEPLEGVCERRGRWVRASRGRSAARARAARVGGRAGARGGDGRRRRAADRPARRDERGGGGRRAAAALPAAGR
jgi:hypothetical protein